MHLSRQTWAQVFAHGAAGACLLAVLSFSLLPYVSHAQTSGTANTIGTGNTTQGTTIGTGNTSTSGCAATGQGQTIANPLKFCSLEQLLDAILDAAIKLGTVVLTLALIYTGFRFVAARGNEESIRSARTALLWTVIGGLILLGAKAIELVISSTVTSLTP